VTASSSRPEVGRLSIGVALRATSLVAAVYLAIAVAVVLFLGASLTAQIDARLARTLEHFSDSPWPVNGPPDRPAGESPLGARAFWGIRPDGRVETDVEELPLPDAYKTIAGPATIVINGIEIRIAGRAAGANHLVVGESLAPVNDARTTVVIAELLLAPVLLLTVFVGAVAIGRRVAMPIELARRRQLDFTADASHELRTPLSVIEANASLALARGRDGAWYRRAFEQVDEEARRMRRLLDDLLWLARFDATQRRADAEPVDLGVMAQQAADRFAPVAEDRRLSVAVRADERGSIVNAPPDWLDRLLGVLLDNACKYSPEGGRVEVSVETGGSQVVLKIDDNGPGIPEDQRQRVFDRFHRAAEAQPGAGLGLSIADAIVQATGGRWQLGSSPLGGARVSVSWAPARSQPGGRRPIATTTPGSEMPGS
jgi:signal transduction histidine kinase